MSYKIKGSYLLIIKLQDDKKILVGKLGKIAFKKGYYVYVGSAMNGLEQRLQRHLRSQKKFHWHIDYLLNQAKESLPFLPFLAFCFGILLLDKRKSVDLHSKDRYHNTQKNDDDLMEKFVRVLKTP